MTIGATKFRPQSLAYDFLQILRRPLVKAGDKVRLEALVSNGMDRVARLKAVIAAIIFIDSAPCLA